MTIPMPIAYGTEAHCYEDFRSWVIGRFGSPPMSDLRSDRRIDGHKRAKAIKHYEDYFKYDLETLCNCPYASKLQQYPYVNYESMSKKIIQFHASCERTIRGAIPRLATIFCDVTYGSVQRALETTHHINELWNAFEEWFEKWRQRMKKIAKAEIEKVMQCKNAVGSRARTASIGGVANLLKVLTKTMEMQGADIRSIAKMQWSVCIQNGVVLPDEFLTDVATALTIEGEFLKVGEL